MTHISRQHSSISAAPEGLKTVITGVMSQLSRCIYVCLLRVCACSLVCFAPVNLCVSLGMPDPTLRRHGETLLSHTVRALTLSCRTAQPSVSQLAPSVDMCSSVTYCCLCSHNVSHLPSLWRKQCGRHGNKNMSPIRCSETSVKSVQMIGVTQCTVSSLFAFLMEILLL